MLDYIVSLKNHRNPSGLYDNKKETRSTTCSGCGGTYDTLVKCLFKEHPDFNKSRSWEKSSALTKLKAKYPDDESRHRLNRKDRIDGTLLEKTIELPKKADKHKGKKGTEVPHNDDDTVI